MTRGSAWIAEQWLTDYARRNGMAIVDTANLTIRWPDGRQTDYLGADIVDWCRPSVSQKAEC